MRTLISSTLAAAALLACTPTVTVQPEPKPQGAGGASSSTSTSVGTTSSTTTTSTSSTSTSSTSGGPVRMITADSDPAQNVDALLTVSGLWTALAVGPFYLTDATPGGMLSLDLRTVDNGDCASGQTQLLLVNGGYESPTMHGGRYFIPAGKTLCSSLSVHIAGFRPYQ